MSWLGRGWLLCSRRRRGVIAAPGETRRRGADTLPPCSSSNAMPREVREALAWCISTDGAGSLEPDAATEYIAEMFDSGRGGEESW